MIRLALAIGFLSVFGVVAYSIVILLTQKNKEKESETKTTEKQ